MVRGAGINLKYPRHLSAMVLLLGRALAPELRFDRKGIGGLDLFILSCAIYLAHLMYHIWGNVWTS